MEYLLSLDYSCGKYQEVILRTKKQDDTSVATTEPTNQHICHASRPQGMQIQEPRDLV